jgi:SAM-dependent methyltransferase
MASHLEIAPIAEYGPAGVRLRCPRCGGWIGQLPDTNTTDNTLICSECYLRLVNDQGIWRALLPERSEYFSCFMKKSECDTLAVIKNRADAEYYLALPYRDLFGQHTQHWNQQSCTFRYIVRHVLPGIVPKYDCQLRILDLGAGNGWMSYRLALAGHAPIAVDLLTNDLDGLGAAVHYKRHLTALFPRFQAEMDALPFVDDEFDLVIYNASFHYSENYERTMAEALRCARDGGTVLIAGTPWYDCERDGQQMLEERREAYALRYGLPSAPLNSLEYLTDKRLHRMEASFGIRWQIHTPNYGVHRLMRQALARLQGTPELSQLRIYSAKAQK